MSYQQTTDQPKISDNRDFKDNLLRASKKLKSVILTDTICIVFKKDKWYYIVADVATWSKCGNIKTVLFYRLEKKPKGKIITFHGKEQFMFKFKNRYAIYSVQVYAGNSYNHDIITRVGFVKIPNLKDCKK